jgi:hypothetical protein
MSREDKLDLTLDRDQSLFGAISILLDQRGDMQPAWESDFWIIRERPAKLER